MRILTGKLSGREICFKANPHLRPTADKVRKAIFDTLAGAVQGSYVLDLFSGTGALGFEALSGGAELVVFVEADKRQAAKIVENLKELGLEKKGRVLSLDALKAFETLHREGEVFDLLFLDPPYGEGWERKTSEAAAKYPILSKKSRLEMESAAKNDLAPGFFGHLTKLKEKKYGDTRLVFYGAL